MKNNDIILEIDDIIHGPFGVKQSEGKTYYIKGAIPGDTILGYIARKKAGIHYVKVKELIQPSAARTQSDCQHFPDCGGCRFRDVVYENQLKIKLSILNNELKNHDIDFAATEIVPAPHLNYYRNKMEFTFGTQDGQVIAGMHKKENFAEIINTSDCFLQSKSSNLICKVILAWANKNNLTSYDPRSHSGILRHLIIREGKNTGQIMVGIVATTESIPETSELATSLWKQIPEMRGLQLIINNNIADTVTYEKINLIKGYDTFEEKLKDKTYTLSLPSFFQTNTPGTEILYTELKQMIASSEAETILDLYCGAGSIGIFCADHDHKIIGVEINNAAVTDAIRNQKTNNIESVNYICQDVKEYLAGFSGDLTSTLVIIDPPREGLHPKARKMLLEKNIPQIIYVSCNPKTLAIDLKELTENYSIKSIKAFDLFPFTPHLESIVLLTKKY